MGLNHDLSLPAKTKLKQFNYRKDYSSLFQMAIIILLYNESNIDLTKFDV